MGITGWSRALGGYAERLHARAGQGHHVVSPLGAWMLIALCAPAARDEQTRDTLAEVLGADPDEAFRLVADLLGDPHRLVAAATGLWLRAGAETPSSKAWQGALPAAVETGDLPTQTALDAWAAEHTLGLINHFPLELTPTAVCLLASALGTRVSWEVPFDVVDAAEIGPSDWSTRIRSVLRAPRDDPRHRQFLATTGRAGTVCVHLAEARGGLLVGSVIAAEESVGRPEVLAVAEEIVTTEAAEPGSAPRLSLFDPSLSDGPLWSLEEEPADSVKDPGGREERVVSILPAWRATTTLDLVGDQNLGFDHAAHIAAEALGLADWDFDARQACVASYSAVGFEATAITALGVDRSAGHPGIRRTATVRFSRPYAVVAVALDNNRLRTSAAPRSPWHGLPIFSAWVAEPCDAD